VRGAAARLADAITTPAWRTALAPVLEGRAFQGLAELLEAERAAGAHVLPAREDVFAALDLVAPADVRVVIVGQDPYPTPGHAHGLAFSYRGKGALPRSLGNVLREVEEDLDTTLSGRHGDLTAWARQGVLLLNTVLTVRAGAAGSHRRRGWEAVTDAVLRHVDALPGRRVFLLWGGDARKKRKLLGAQHLVLEAGHPSPLSVRHFRGCRHFSRANAALPPPAIDWAAL